MEREFETVSEDHRSNASHFSLLSFLLSLFLSPALARFQQGCYSPPPFLQTPIAMSAAAVDRALYALAPPGGGTVLPPAVSAALPRVFLASALVLVSAWVLGPLGGLATKARVVSRG
jgi:hypothetical protein